ncbi:MAG: hypothetical protein WC223_00725 [Bacteroidales bacterium]|jgi:glycosyltransferase involved in cell wall biosynthesis
MNKKKIFVIGYNVFCEQMYPHLFEFLNLIGNDFDLVYYGKDDRGFLSYYKTEKTIGLPFLKKIKFIKNCDLKINTIKSEIKKILESKIFDIIIVIDHSAINYISETIGTKGKTKLFFWSHDILTNDHPLYVESKHIREIINNNKKNIQNFDLIIIQDHARAAVLDSVLNTHNIKKFYFPVSLNTDNTSINIAFDKSKRDFFETINLLQIGFISNERFSDDILDEYLKAKDNINLTFLGRISDELSEMIEKASKKVFYHEVQSSFIEMRKIISNSDIGIIGNRPKTLNNHFYSKSCGQMVEYLRCGIPVIIVGNEELGEFVENENCGVFIQNINELTNAINKIKQKYPSFSKKSHDTFSKFFNLSNHFLYFRDFIKNQN